MKESLRITKQMNGYTVRLNVVLEDDTEEQQTFVYEEASGDRHVLDFVADVLGYFGEHKVVEQLFRVEEKEDSEWHGNSGPPMEEDYPG